MADNGSVAPKERVNIVYRSSTGNASEDVELPLKQLVIGDFTLKDDSRNVEDIKPINIDKDNFSDVLKAQEISMQLIVPNMLADNASDGEEQASMAVNLNFESLHDFEPDSLVEQIPELKKLIELRDALKALKGPLGNLPEFRKQLQSLVKDEETRQRLVSELGIEDKE
ncbi:type VI secretion system contractile sheath small subunit [Citrobacter sp. RHBSTW-00671]|uniref:type VI secretion system contractile sheath small subunit n=1 Tax=Citrobacter sp. RHBSTW-00671 TaxID=2742660 RepID=UPI0017B17146|nr:type VI secretion system contractile sheath small subunit [Citrobacter sp. RHBSTW-00671]MBA7966549.1 type VI secretion system contractile sheath small subunit [Citrobacter sp. RHBSTW-00671]HCJ6373905.1 type VI secretion system contractile sheath small subunit [Citrobacter freundii]